MLLKETKDQIVQAMESYIAMHKISQNDFCRTVEVNASYIINIRKGDYSFKYILVSL